MNVMPGTSSGVSIRNRQVGSSWSAPVPVDLRGLTDGTLSTYQRAVVVVKYIEDGLLRDAASGDVLRVSFCQRPPPISSERILKMVVEQLDDSFKGTHRGEIRYQVRSWVIASSIVIKNMAMKYQLHRHKKTSDIQYIEWDKCEESDLVAAMETENNLWEECDESDLVDATIEGVSVKPGTKTPRNSQQKMDGNKETAVYKNINNEISWEECDESDLETVMETGCALNAVKNSVESVEGNALEKQENSNSDIDLESDPGEWGSCVKPVSGSETQCKLSGGDRASRLYCSNSNNASNHPEYKPNSIGVYEESSNSDYSITATDKLSRTLVQLENPRTRGASDHLVKRTEVDNMEEKCMSTVNVMITENSQELLNLEELMKLVQEDSQEKQHCIKNEYHRSSLKQSTPYSQGDENKLDIYDVLMTSCNRMEIEDSSETGFIVNNLNTVVSPNDQSKDQQNNEDDGKYSQVNEEDTLGMNDSIMEKIEAPPKWNPVEDEFEAKNKLIFAKVKGFPYWPAYLEDTHNQKGRVVFNNGSLGTAMKTLSFDNTSKLWILKHASFSTKRGHTRKDFLKACSLMEQQV